eukprot:1514975-Rhodomonas_salina.1
MLSRARFLCVCVCVCARARARAVTGFGGGAAAHALRTGAPQPLSLAPHASGLLSRRSRQPRTVCNAASELRSEDAGLQCLGEHHRLEGPDTAASALLESAQRVAELEASLQEERAAREEEQRQREGEREASAHQEEEHTRSLAQLQVCCLMAHLFLLWCGVTVSQCHTCSWGVVLSRLVLACWCAAVVSAWRRVGDSAERRRSSSGRRRPETRSLSLLPHPLSISSFACALSDSSSCSSVCNEMPGQLLDLRVSPSFSLAGARGDGGGGGCVGGAERKAGGGGGGEAGGGGQGAGGAERGGRCQGARSGA